MIYNHLCYSYDPIKFTYLLIGEFYIKISVVKIIINLTCYSNYFNEILIDKNSFLF